jgi:tetratricopeptide (TPR) repeat protein
MSYIHQALKKAQAERDDRHGKYEGVLHPSRPKRSAFARRSIVIAVAALVILFLAFISYSWLDSIGPQATTENRPRPKPAAPAPTPVSNQTADADALYQVGKTHHTNGRLSDAKVFYGKALKADPGCVAALNNLGVILMMEKNFAEAQSGFEKAIRLKPGYVDPCYNLACLFALTDQPEKGIHYLKRAVSLDPQVKGWATKDADMEKLRSEPGFAEMVD